MFCQDSYCLSANFTNCPVYKTDWSGPLPFDIRAGSLGTRRGSGYYTWLALGAVILLLTLSFATILIFLKDRPTIPDYQSVAQATSPIYESLMVTGTSIPAPALLIVPTSTPTFPPTQTRVGVSANTPTAIPTQTRAVISISTPTTGPTQALVVIATSTPTSIPTQTPIVCAPPEDWVAYTVQPGDSLQLFRQIYGIRKSRILVANCNEGLEEVIPGQIFFLPYLPSTPISVVEPPVVPPNQLPRYTPQPEPPSYRP